MPIRATKLLRLAAMAATLALAACNRSDEGNLAALDNQLTTNDSDPALTSALQDQIAVDPQLTQQSNRNAVRPPETPTQAQYPVTRPGDTMSAPEPGRAKGADVRPAQLSAAPGGGPECIGGAKFDYNLAWAQRLSPTFPVYPNSKVTEAAANNANGCRARVVTFTTNENFQRVLDWYHTQAVRAGYSSEHQVRDGDHILAGSNERDGGAFYLIVTPVRAGSEVALIANNGR